MVSWPNLPYEVQQNIVVELVSSLDTIHHLTDILLLSKDVHDSLVGSPERGVQVHDDIYLRIFQKMFDFQAVKRRLGQECILTPNIFASVLKRRCQLLKEVRNGLWMERIMGKADWDEYRPEDTLWEIYLMLLEDDGNNMKHLDYCHVEEFLRNAMLLLIQNDLDADGWPAESVHLKLAAASFAIVSDRASVLLEDEDTTEAVCGALETIVMGPHRYGYSHVPITVSTVYQLNDIPHVPPGSLRTVATMPISEPVALDYFGHRLMLSPPPLAPSVFPIITNRREKMPMNVLVPGMPATRAEALELGWQGATAADWQELNALREMAIGVETPRADGDRVNLSGLINPPKGSARWDHTFNRMRAVADAVLNKNVSSMNTWFHTLYQPGMFSGNWLGRVALPTLQMTHRVAALHPATLATVRATLPEHDHYMLTVFFQANLREHITSDTPVSTDYGSIDGGVQNAYFPVGVDPATRSRFWPYGGDSVVVEDPMEPDAEFAQKRYYTWHEEMKAPVVVAPLPVPPLDRIVPPIVSGQIEMQMQPQGWQGGATTDLMEHAVMERDEDDDNDVDTDDVPEDVEMDFEHEGVGEEVPTLDVIITGETDYLHGAAWGNHAYYGRVRKLDGLVVLVRTAPYDPEQGRWIFAGHMTQAGTIVGSCRVAGAAINSIVFQGPFIISKVGSELFIHDHPAAPAPPIWT